MSLRYHRLPTLISLCHGFLLVALSFLCLDHSSPGFLVVVPVHVHAYHSLVCGRTYFREVKRTHETRRVRVRPESLVKHS